MVTAPGRAVSMMASIILLSACTPSEEAQYAASIEAYADSVVILWATTADRAEIQEKARDFEAVVPPAKLAAVHAQLSRSATGVASGRSNAELAQQIMAYMDARQRAARMLAESRVSMRGLPQASDMLAWWTRPGAK